jgi:hypothetical protein
VGGKPAIQNDDSTDYLILPVLILDSLITMNNYQNIRKDQSLIHKTLYSSEFYLLLTFLVMLVFFVDNNFRIVHSVQINNYVYILLKIRTLREFPVEYFYRKPSF